MMAEIGHNNPPMDFGDFFDLITDSSATAHEKLLRLVIARLAQKAGGKVAPRRIEILYKASCSEATFKRSFSSLKEFFDVNPKKGRRTEYTPKRQLTAYEIEVAANAVRDKTRDHSDTYSEKKASKPRVTETPSAEPSVDLKSKTKGHGDTNSVGAENVPPHPPKINPSGYNTPLTPQRPRSRRDPFGLNATLQAEHQDVWFDGDDRLQVANGFEAELLEIVGGRDQLRIELDCATERIGPKTPGTVLKAKVRGQIQRQLAIRRDQDRRYAEGAAKRQGKPYDSDDEMRRRRELMKLLES